jgi:CheY-like chemotaxis protein
VTAENNLILVVEDDPNDVALLQRAFRKIGSTSPLQVLSDGEQAVAYLAGEGEYGDRSRYPVPTLILLDLKLPRRSGHEVLAWIRSQPVLRRLPVVVLTSSKEGRDLDQAYDQGASSYLVKPARFDALLEIVRTLKLYWIILNEPPRVPL